MQKYKAYRPIPFWSWNDELEPEKLKEQIQWMDEKGNGGFFMHARSGLVTEYLSEQWMECIKVCAQEAKRLGMKAWAYDENGWPSGFAGGKLLENEANRDQYITYDIGDYRQDATVSYLLLSDTIKRVDNDMEKGQYLNLYIHTSMSTADILNPDVVKKFITLTHEKYRECLGDDFEDLIEGFFTDEPQYYRDATPYTVMIAKLFKEEYGEDILDSLGLLFVEKEGYRRFRYRYWKGMQSLMLSSFAEQIYRWCEDNGVMLTGHYVQEDSLGLQNMCCGGVMPFYEFEHIPGIDWLGKEAHQIGELSPKQVGSVAAQLGKKQIITETFGCCGWDVTPAELKRIAGFQFVNGVNMLCHHLIPYTERGNRKYDYPAHYSKVNPWVSEAFEDFNAYFTKLGYLLGEGESHVNVAMLHPIRSSYFDYKREDLAGGFGLAKQEERLKDAMRMLSSRNIEYHFLDETLLEKYGFVEKSRIGCGKCSYEYLVLPHILTMDKSTEVLIRAFVKNGGKVLILGDKPKFLEAEEYAYDYLVSTCTLDDIIKNQPFHVTDLNTVIYSTYRRMGNEKYLYVINASDTQTYEQTFTFKGNIHSFEQLDLLSGEKKSVACTITLKPGEDALLYLSEKEVEMAPLKNTKAFYFNDAEVVVEKNVLPVDKVAYSFDGVEFSTPWPHEALFQKLLKEKYRGKIYFRYDFWIQEIPNQLVLRTELDGRTSRAWFNGCLLENVLSTDEFYVKMYNVCNMAKKGKNTYVVETDWYENDYVYYALFGKNVTESLRNCVKYDSELQPIYIEGDFGVYPTNGYQSHHDERYIVGNDFYIGKQPVRATDFVIEGFPFLSGEVTLKQSVFLSETNCILHIPGEYQMADVKINGNYAGRLFYEKELDISEVAREGENQIEVRFWISCRNKFGPLHYNGQEGWISPWTFELYHSWNDDQSPHYLEDYVLKKFYASIATLVAPEVE